MRRRGLALLSAAVTLALVLAGAGAFLLLDPRSPLPDAWNPLTPLDIAAAPTPVTRWKLARSHDGPACRAALTRAGIAFTPLPDLNATPDCHIRDRIRLTGLGTVAIDPVETRCATALRLALWTRYGLEPAAKDLFGTGIARVHHLSSYNCRPIRTTSGTGGRMSTHATADAIDITGVTLDDGRRIALKSDWGQGRAGDFLKAARNTSCTWFATTLGPDYNTLHADHFHLQTRGWGLCR